MKRTTLTAVLAASACVDDERYADDANFKEFAGQMVEDAMVLVAA